jgi:transcriptional regulator with XRE-family HTH domain
VSGLTLAEVSATSGLSKGYLSKLESGAPAAANPSRATLAALARALPAFRPLAHALEPGLDSADLDYTSGAPPATWASAAAPPVSQDGEMVSAAPSDSLRLGWRELEILAVLVVLDSAALPVPVTVPILARATGRPPTEVAATVAHLVAQSVIVMDLPPRPGGAAACRCAAEAAARLGVARLGDLLLLAAALLAGASARGDTSFKSADTGPGRATADSLRNEQHR